MNTKADIVLTLKKRGIEIEEDDIRDYGDNDGDLWVEMKTHTTVTIKDICPEVELLKYLNEVKKRMESDKTISEQTNRWKERFLVLNADSSDDEWMWIMKNFDGSPEELEDAFQQYHKKEW